MTLWIGVNSKIDSYDLLDKIILKKDYIVDKLGAEVEFDKKEGVISTKVNLYYNKDVDILTISDQERDLLIDWIIELMPKFEKTLQTIINEIE
jgi:hypothetical protein